MSDMSNKKLSEIGLSKLWEKVFSLIKLLIGDVKVSEKGTLQAQVDELQDRFTTLAREQSVYQSVDDSEGVYIEDSNGEKIEGKIVYKIA